MDVFTIALLVAFVVLIPIVIAQFFAVRKLTGTVEKLASQRQVTMEYYEYLEDVSGILKDSKKFIVKGQILYDGVPVGPQFVVSEHVIEKFDYEKLKQFRTEILIPCLRAGAEAAMAFKTGGASLLKTGEAAKQITSAVKDALHSKHER